MADTTSHRSLDTSRGLFPLRCKFWTPIGVGFHVAGYMVSRGLLPRIRLSAPACLVGMPSTRPLKLDGWKMIHFRPKRGRNTNTWYLECDGSIDRSRFCFGRCKENIYPNNTAWSPWNQNSFVGSWSSPRLPDCFKSVYHDKISEQWPHPWSCSVLVYIYIYV